MTNSNNKPCRKCGSTERYKPPLGHKLGRCKACHKTRNKAWQKANPEKNRASSRAWSQANPEKHRAKIKAWRKTNPEKIKNNNYKYEKNNPEKRAAHLAVRNAVKHGDLPRVSTCDCVDCGIQAAEYHHEDYNKPLEVVALCKKCHFKRHQLSNNEFTDHPHQA